MSTALVAEIKRGSAWEPIPANLNKHASKEELKSAACQLSLVHSSQVRIRKVTEKILFTTTTPK